jgi:hypothetical protein
MGDDETSTSESAGEVPTAPEAEEPAPTELPPPMSAGTTEEANNRTAGQQSFMERIRSFFK